MSFVLLKLATVIGVIWWLLALAWLRAFNFASDHDTHARVFKLAAGTLAVIPAWCALAWLHAEPSPGRHFPPIGHRWLFVALAIVWAADSAAYCRHAVASAFCPLFHLLPLRFIRGERRVDEPVRSLASLLVRPPGGAAAPG